MASTMATEDKDNRIFLWFNPRSMSTAFTKCVSFMEGAHVWNEPYASCMLNEWFSNPEDMKRYPKLESTFQQLTGTCKKVQEFGHYYDGGTLKPTSVFTHEWFLGEIIKPLPKGKSFLFIKEDAACISGRFEMLPKVSFKHSFIIRNPLRSVSSVRKLFMTFFGYEDNPDDFDLYESNPFLDSETLPPNPCYDVWKYVKTNIDPNPVVIDADDLRNFPDKILRKYCEGVGIPFKAKYTKWERSDSSMKYFNGSLDLMVWGKQNHVYDTAFESDCFTPTTSPLPQFDDLTPDGQRYVLDLQDGFNEMYQSRLKP